MQKKKVKSRVLKRCGKKISRKKRVSSVKEITPGLADIDTFYKIVNRIQLNREFATFCVTQGDSAIVENIMKDLELQFKHKKVKNSLIEYSVHPAHDKERAKNIDVEELSDEILEEGQVFF